MIENHLYFLFCLYSQHQHVSEAADNKRESLWESDSRGRTQERGKGHPHAHHRPLTLGRGGGQGGGAYVLTHEAAKETEHGDGHGQGPVPVDHHLHGPGGPDRDVIRGEEYAEQTDPDQGHHWGKPGEWLKRFDKSQTQVFFIQSLTR